MFCKDLKAVLQTSLIVFSIQGLLHGEEAPFDALVWDRPVDQPVFTVEHFNNHDPILFVEPGKEYPYYMIICHNKEYGQLWRARSFSWSSKDWELVEKNYVIDYLYEFDDGVKVGDTYYLYGEGTAYTYSGDLASSSGKWKKAGTFPDKECNDPAVYYEDGVFHLFGELGKAEIQGGMTLAHYTSTTGLGDWNLFNSRAVDVNPDFGDAVGVGDATITKVGETYYLWANRYQRGTVPHITAWKTDDLNNPFSFIGSAIKPRSGKKDDWDNAQTLDPEVAFIPELEGWVIACNMMDSDGDPGYPNQNKKTRTRVVGFFYHADIEKVTPSN